MPPLAPVLLQAAEGDPPFPADAVEVGRIVGAWGVKGGLKVKPFSADPQALFSSKRWFLQAPAPTGMPSPKRTRSAAPQWPLLLRIVQAREQGDHVVASAQDLDDRDAAEALGGARIFVARASFPTPADDEFYWVDLIGLAVQNREGLVLGQVIGLLETGPSCVLRVLPALPPGGRAATRPAAAAAAAAAQSAQAGTTGVAVDKGEVDEGEGSGKRAGREAGGDSEVSGSEAGAEGECLIPFVAAYVDRVDLAGRCIHVDWAADFI